jgi:hypothetical protein
MSVLQMMCWGRGNVYADVRIVKAAAAEGKGRFVHGVGDLGQKPNDDGENQSTVQ